MNLDHEVKGEDKMQILALPRHEARRRWLAAGGWVHARPSVQASRLVASAIAAHASHEGLTKAAARSVRLHQRRRAVDILLRRRGRCATQADS